MQTRVLKIQKNVHRVLMDYFLTKSSRSYPGIISVKVVEIQSDLKKANVYISVMGSRKDFRTTCVKLEEDRMKMRSLINQRLRMKYCPYLKFFVNHIDLPLTSVEQTLLDLREKGEAGP